MERPVPKIRLFGYGSLMSEKNLRARAPSAQPVAWARASGWRAFFAKVGTNHVYLTIAPTGGELDITFGRLIDVDPPALAVLAQHEPGYRLVDVTDAIRDAGERETTFAFIAEVEPIPPAKARIKRSYINKCMAELPLEIREEWLARWGAIPEGVTIDEDA